MQTVKLNLTFSPQPYNRGQADGRGSEDLTDYDETFPDIASMSDEELKATIEKLAEEEREVSYRRRILHGKIDILRAELVNRLKGKREDGETVITGADVQQLTDILLGKVPDAERAEGT